MAGGLFKAPEYPSTATLIKSVRFRRFPAGPQKSNKTRITPNAARRKANGSLLPFGVKPNAKYPASVSTLSARETAPKATACAPARLPLGGDASSIDSG